MMLLLTMVGDINNIEKYHSRQIISKLFIQTLCGHFPYCIKSLIKKQYNKLYNTQMHTHTPKHMFLHTQAGMCSQLVSTCLRFYPCC